MYLRLDAQREILAHGYSSFEVLLAFLTNKISSKMWWPEDGKRVTRTYFILPIMVHMHF